MGVPACSRTLVRRAPSRSRALARKAWPELLHDAADSGWQARWLPSRLVPHRHRPRAELQPAHELQVDTLR
jgi:hypothetical protein